MASHVIFTASLGVLKEKHMTMFTPLLPERKQNAIKACKSLMLMSNIEICLFFGMHLIWNAIVIYYLGFKYWNCK